MAIRLDVGSLGKPRKLASGHLRLDAYLTREGVFEYRNPDGTVRRELRPADEVFRKDSLDSFASVPLTNDHPPGLLDAKNTREHVRGVVGESVRRDGDKVRTQITVYDAELIELMQAHGKAEISCGYTCDVEESAGVWNGQRYDAIQRNIRGNHVAVVANGRAGSEVRARMDAASQVGQAPHTPEDMTVETISINGVPYEVSAQVAAAYKAQEGTRSDAAAKTRQDAADAQSRIDALNGELVGVKADLAAKTAALAAASDPAKVQAAVAARVELVTTAGKHGVKCDGLSDRAVKAAVVKAVLKLDVAEGDSDDAVGGMFKAALKAVSTQSMDATRGALNDASRSDALDVEDQARAAMIARNRNGGKDPK